MVSETAPERGSRGHRRRLENRLAEAGRWSAGVAALGYVEPAEYGCAICRRGPTRYFRFLTVDERVWYVGSGFAGHLCWHCSIGMGRAYQVQTVARPWRSLLALPIAALMMISNAITLRAGRAPLRPPEPNHPSRRPHPRRGSGMAPPRLSRRHRALAVGVWSRSRRVW